MSVESKSTLTQQTAGTSKLNVMLGKDLYSVIRTVKKNMQPLTTYEEVIDGLKTYIWNKQLVDPRNPFRICCKGDALGSVFGLEEFTVFDVKTILLKWITPINQFTNSPGNSSQSSFSMLSKRKLEEAFASMEQKKMCYDETSRSSSPMLLYIPPSPSKCGSFSDESSDSVQANETAFATDTSDTILFSSDNDYLETGEEVLVLDDTFNVEYEVETDSSDCSIAPDSSSDSEEDFVAAEVAMDAALLTFVCKGDSDIEFFADDSSDEEIPKSDHWKCVKCNFSNRPTIRYCGKCWQERTEWFTTENADNSKKRKKKGKKTLTRNSSSSSKSSQDSQETTCSDVQNSSPQASCSSSDTHESESNLCIICCAKPAAACIIHGKYAHQISCYKCARTLQKRKKPCPICRKSIERVVHLISTI